ncbi:Uncharacterised protein [Salmonella enterica subsp. enterica serovar Typhi]|nr:Uncharacterised protein [Salmonella enterica subsp. enterica serovar Typhi]CHJ79605.1 Uncharacterised protein [Salmonella enterica subsp. enterica serovar Typhi]CQS01722.1 Uncharacterised protein [Salmonella enterica subsp. enterica serovar Typhi]
MGRGTILHARVRQHRFPYRCMNIYPVNYRIRPAKMVAERLPGFNAYHFFGIHGIHHGNVIGKHRTLAGNIAHTETIQRRKSVRPKLNTRANLANFVRFFQQHDFYSLARQRQRGRRAADSATYNNCACHVSHGHSPFQAGILSC